MKKTLVLFTCVSVIAGLVLWRFAWPERKPQANTQVNPQARNERPNIILIYTDDIDCESLYTVWPDQPNDRIRFPTLRKLAQSGTTFTNFHVTTPVCGPSRACLLSGQYAHKNQVRVNTPNARSSNGFSGGYLEFDQDNEIGIWMKQSGYLTAFVGKYMHDNFVPGEEKQHSWKSIIPRGWDHFRCVLGGRYLQYAQFGTHQDGLSRAEQEYRTDFESRHVVDLIGQEFSGSGKPFFLCWAPFAAHLSPELDEISADRHRDLFQDEVPDGIRNAEAHWQIPDAPAELASIPAYSRTGLDRWSGVHQKRLRAMQALDEGIAQMMEALKRSGQLENTLIMFTSDHGFSMGQHRHFGKRLPYERITRVPFIVSGPGVPEGGYCDQLLANIDIAPTLVALAGGQPSVRFDGISFAGLLRNPTMVINREGIILENWDRIWSNTVEIEAAYCAFRSMRHLYTEWASGSFEYYDLETDPEQLVNLYPQLDRNRQVELADQLRRHRGKNGFDPVIGNEFTIPERYKERKVMSGNFDPVPFTGFVEDDDGVAGVELELYCPKINSYWNGQRWSETPSTVSATLSMPNGHITRWMYELDTRSIAFSETERMNRRDVVVNLIATDVNDNQTHWPTAFEFKMKINDPETWIDPLEKWTDKNKPLRVTGRAADNFQLKRVDLLVVDLDREMFWDDNRKEWIKERTTFPVDLTFLDRDDQPGHHGTWSYDFNGPQKGKIFFLPPILRRRRQLRYVRPVPDRSV